jgi:hypothetical protein
MSYSLLNRFQGTLIGGLVGETLPHPDLTQQPRESMYEGAIAPSVQCLIATRSASSLKIEVDHAIASTISIALYFHDNRQKLRQAIIDTASPAIQDFGFVVAESIAVALQPQMNPWALLPELIQLLPDEVLSQKLRQVQRLLTRRDSLAIAIQKLGDSQQIEVAISLAFYCWLSTAEQFQLSVLRAHRIPNVSPLTLLLTGAFSGALNGQAGIPLAWLSPTGAFQNSLKHMETLADQLLATWSGCYHVGPDTVDPIKERATASGLPLAVASPGILRPR